MDKFTKQYLETALWSSTDNGGEPLDGIYSIDDFSQEAIIQAMEDCRAFQEENDELLEGVDLEQAGHDFWLTRNRHGAGFWDRGLGKVGDKLTESSHAWGGAYIYVGGDGMLYIG